MQPDTGCTVPSRYCLALDKLTTLIRWFQHLYKQKKEEQQIKVSRMAPKLTFKQQMQGFPWTQLLVISLVRFSEPIAFTSLFPYVYFMVKDFKIAPDEAQVSKYSGYLSSTFALCQVLSSLQWGKFSDKYGRKPALFIGLCGTCASSLILGFSQNFYQALFARSLMGLLNGNVAVLRTVIGEVASERRHQALAFSTMPLLFQFGSVIGPMIGGFFSFPKGSDNNKEVPKWFPKPIAKMVEKYPYSMPNIVICFLLIIGLINAVLFLEETHPVCKYRKDYGLEVGDFIKRKIFCIEPKQRPWNNNLHRVPSEESPLEYADEETPLLNREDSNETYGNDPDSDSADSIQSIGRVLTRRESITLIRTYSLREATDEQDKTIIASDGCQESSIFHLVFHTNVFYPVSVNFITSLHLIVYNEFLPVFLAYDLAAKTLPDGSTQLLSKFPWKISGGIGFQPEQTGTLLSTTGILGCVFVIFLFPVVDRNFDCLTVFRTFIKLYPVMYLMVPYVVFLQQDRIPRWYTTVYLYFITGVKTLVGTLSLPQIMLLIHNSSPLKYRAIINSATTSVNALAGFTGPLVWGIIMSWSEENDVAWLSWWSLGLISIIALFQSYKIKPIDDEEEIVVEESDTNNHGLRRRRSSLNYMEISSKNRPQTSLARNG